MSPGFRWIRTLFKCWNRCLDEMYRFHKQILRVKDRDEFPMLLVANKCDLEAQRVVPSSEIAQRAQQLKIPFVECSAMQGRNVDNAFYELVRQVRRFQAAERPPIRPSKSKPRVKCTIL
ncbi:ras-like protein 2 [Trichonephila inaurata madagascariensis]|uniref:Ras-like protein 2 n=1 Tax=Trichonephila inaurata madagascariensis TaxID=2747483 RepID=A0A8X6J3Q3_9ARAC|nr:ras-like protein 2 [Trichonephila inaurata madagascariensis]